MGKLEIIFLAVALLLDYMKLEYLIRATHSHTLMHSLAQTPFVSIERIEKDDEKTFPSFDTRNVWNSEILHDYTVHTYRRVSKFDPIHAIQMYFRFSFFFSMNFVDLYIFLYGI